MRKKIYNNNSYNKKVVIFVLIIAAIITFTVLASDVPVDLIEENGIQYLKYELEHNLSNAQYKYYGYGYTVTLYDNQGKEVCSKYLPNKEFLPTMVGNKEIVKIPIETIFNKLGVDQKFYYRNGCQIYLNGRLGIKVNGVLTHLYDSYEGVPAKGIDYLQGGYATEDSRTVPLNKDLKGIANGLKNEYGVSWSSITYMNLSQHFGINYIIDPIYVFDGYEVQYKEVGTEKTVYSPKPIQNFKTTKTITEFPETVNGYEYSGYYKIEKTDSNGNTTVFKDLSVSDSATVNLAQTSSIYTITFYYNKIDLSKIGKPVTIEVEYRENTSTGKKLLNNKNIIGGELSKFNLSSEKIENYTCVGHYVIGQATEYFYDTNARFTIGENNYSKPVDGKLKIIFIYKEVPYVSDPKCDPTIYGDFEIINITMKKKDFENAHEISVINAVIKIDDFKAGTDNKGTVEGSHGLNYFDIYIGEPGNYYFTSYDNKGKQILANFNVPKNIFTKSSSNPNLYTTSLDVIYAGFCTCFDGKPDSDGDRGWSVDYGNLGININLIENKPPVADFTYYTQKKINGEIKGVINENAYVNQEIIINNKAYDPNGKEDIKKLIYTLRDNNKNEYKINLLMLNGNYFLESDNVNANNIKFLGAEKNGDIKLIFNTEETWIINQYIEDIEGLNDTYEKNVTTKILNLKPTAVIEDNIYYRYPVTKPFNGKQNRVIMIDSSYSYVADFYLGLTGVKINHNRDNWEIEPMDNQDINSIKFDKNLNLIIEDNTIKIKYQDLRNTKLMFKQTGRYKIRLQVTDTIGNVSEWSEKIITINPDLLPTVIAMLPEKVYRDSYGIAEIKINNISPYSSDEDEAVIENIKYRYDTNNNNDFEDEVWIDLNLISTLKTKNLGRYQFEITVKELFGQETINDYLNDTDIKRNKILLHTEVDNISPIITEFKIMTTE